MIDFRLTAIFVAISNGLIATTAKPTNSPIRSKVSSANFPCLLFHQFLRLCSFFLQSILAKYHKTENAHRMTPSPPLEDQQPQGARPNRRGGRRPMTTESRTLNSPRIAGEDGDQQDMVLEATIDEQNIFYSGPPRPSSQRTSGRRTIGEFLINNSPFSVHGDVPFMLVAPQNTSVTATIVRNGQTSIVTDGYLDGSERSYQGPDSAESNGPTDNLPMNGHQQELSTTSVMTTSTDRRRTNRIVELQQGPDGQTFFSTGRQPSRQQYSTSQGNNTGSNTNSPLRNKIVYNLHCAYCQTHICGRAMRAILLADTKVELYSTDIPPSRLRLLDDDRMTQGCNCKIRDTACQTWYQIPIRRFMVNFYLVEMSWDIM